MRNIVLGKTGIEISYLGIGTSWAYQGILCPAKLKVEDYPDLLRYAYENGVNFWDTSLTYGSHPSIRRVLNDIPRDKVVICSKTIATKSKMAEEDVGKTLKEIGIDYIDILLMQCVRNKFDFWYRARVLDKLCEIKRKGYIRAVGIASHGLGALEACIDSEKIDLIMGRINYQGHLMDSRQDNLKSVLAGIPSIKKLAAKVFPRDIFKSMASSVQKPIASKEDRGSALRIFQELSMKGKCIIGMKVLGEGHLANDVFGAIKYVKSLAFISSIVVGCCTKEELLEVIKIINLLYNEKHEF